MKASLIPANLATRTGLVARHGHRRGMRGTRALIGAARRAVEAGDPVGVGLVERLALEQRSASASRRSRCSLSRPHRALVALVDDPADLVVDELAGALRRRRRRCPGTGAARRRVRAAPITGPTRRTCPSGRPSARAMLRDLLEVGLRAGGDVAVDDLLGRPAAQRADDPAAQVAPRRSRSGRRRASGTSRPAPARAGTIETLRTGSAPGSSMPSRAWPDSW